MTPAPAALALAFLSGAAGLVYEVLWAKSLALVLGSAAWAQTVVLAAFLLCQTRKGDVKDKPFTNYSCQYIHFGY